MKIQEINRALIGKKSRIFEDESLTNETEESQNVFDPLEILKKQQNNFLYFHDGVNSAPLFKPICV